MTQQRYMAKRHIWEWGLWIVYLLVAFVTNSIISWFDLERGGSDFHAWEPVVWEFSSTFVLGFLVLAVLRFDRLFPIQLDTWRTHLLAHALFTVVFSLLHVTLMYWMRVALYELIGNNSGYLWHNWWVEFGYEYLKDFRTYFSLIAVIYLYRFVLRRWQGEAGFLTEGEEEIEPVAVVDRFLIKKLGREFLVRVDHIDWIESSGNYVNLHVGERVYPLRETMTNINRRLASQGFQRVHRSAIVNLDRINELVTFETNDGEVCLNSGARIPASRRYRKELRERLKS